VEGEENHVDDSQLKISKFDASQFSGKLATGEESDEVLFTDRGKLYVKVGAEWKERATGPVKLSMVKTLNKVRFIVRTDKILKVRANFLVDSRVSLKPNGEKAWAWAALDFSDEEKPQGEMLTLTLKFNTKESADNFHAVYEKARVINGKTDAGGAVAVPASSPKASAPAASAPPPAAASEDKSGPVPRTDSIETIYTAADSDAQVSLCEFHELRPPPPPFFFSTIA